MLDASVDQSPPRPAAEGRRYFAAFEFADGTRATRAFETNTGELWRGTRAPSEFGAAIDEAARRR